MVAEYSSNHATVTEDSGLLHRLTDIDSGRQAGGKVTGVPARGSNGDFIIFSARRPNEVIVPRSLRADIARWYRWLAQPDDATAIAREEVPKALRPWLVEENVPASGPSTTRSHARDTA